MSARSDRVKVIEQAEKYVRGGRIKEAIAEYEKLAISDPQDVGTINIIGDLFIRLGHTERAVRSFEKVAEEYEKRGLYSQALAISKKIYRLVPDSVDFALKLGDLYAQQGFVADAKNVYVAIAGRLAGAGKTAEAVAIFEKIVTLDREDGDARKALAGLFAGLGNLDAALDQLNELAAVRAEKGQFDAAEAVLNEALSMKPGTPEASSAWSRSPSGGASPIGPSRSWKRSWPRPPTTSSSSTSSATSTSKPGRPSGPRRSSPRSSPATRSTSTRGSSSAGSRSSRTSSIRPTSSSSPSSTTWSRSTGTRRPSASWGSSWRARSPICPLWRGWP